MQMSQLNGKSPSDDLNVNVMHLLIITVETTEGASRQSHTIYKNSNLSF